MSSKSPSMKHCKKCLHECIKRHTQLSKRLSPSHLLEFETLLTELDQSHKQHDLKACQVATLKLESFLSDHGKKNFWDHIKEFVFAILIALAVAGVVRQVWFELYEIPTGSMRPTFKENDRVLVVKDAFGINVPFQTSHFYFDRALLKRGNIVVLTGDKLDLPDVDTVYFGIFPGKRRYVKRMVAMNGDTIYFYGGKIYGVDKEGVPFDELYPIEHIPFITFEGKVTRDSQSKQTFFINHLNEPIARIESTPFGKIKREIKTPTGWQSEKFTSHSVAPENFGEFWGINNFAQSRLIEPNALPKKARDLGYAQNDATLYLELKHSPTLAAGSKNELLNTHLSWLPLDAALQKQLAANLYTARFYVKNGIAYRYTPEGADMSHKGVKLGNKIPDGCYEFYNGVAYEIGLGSIAHVLDSEHPLYPKTPSALATLYNFGIELFQFNNTEFFPSRYTYFRDGDLYTLGGILAPKTNPALAHFVETEKKRTGYDARYIPFVDTGVPDSAHIKAFGYTVPEGHYLLLGDNHAMSNDSRFFGPVPEVNIQGSPILTFWPPGSGWGAPTQPEIPLLRLPHCIILATFMVTAGVSYWVISRRRSKFRDNMKQK